MGKIVFWLVIFFVILFALRLLNVAKARSRGPRSPKADTGTTPAAMVRCIECGVYLPKTDARPVPQGYHCETLNCAQHKGR